MKTVSPNSIVGYHGGGYDGCIWEWNYAYIDKDGVFHDVYSSGALGCKTLEELRHKLDHKDTSFCNVTNEAELNKFSDSESINSVARCAAWFADNLPEIKFMVRCDCCGKRIDIIGSHAENIRGEGGVSLAPTELICDECCEKHSCSVCHEFYGPDHKFASTKHYSHACEHCAKEDGGPEEE